MTRVSDQGIFEAALPDEKEFFKYDLAVTGHDGGVKKNRDPYSFLPVMREEARYLFNEGNHYRVYDDLGSHVRDVDGARGVVFAVWAPNAKRVSVVGDFNGWDGRAIPCAASGRRACGNCSFRDLTKEPFINTK